MPLAATPLKISQSNIIMKEILFSYLKQESTWRGIIQIATAAGIALNPAQAAALIAIGTALVGVINTFKNR
jgi:hypothetical protein